MSLPKPGTFSSLSSLGTAALRLLPAETAHNLTLSLLQSGVAGSFLPGTGAFARVPESLKIILPGMAPWSHPIGLAAGLDKNGVAISAWQAMGFAAVEVGTVTPMAQDGNPKPRLFRLPERRSIINRMGFNNHGVDALVGELDKIGSVAQRIPLGINLGKNKITPAESALRDYEAGFRAVSGRGDYYVINVSSPNTPGLRDLARPEFLRQLATMAGGACGKVWIKLDPDMERGIFCQNIEAVGTYGFAGVILSNTHRVDWPEAGGLSGHGLLSLANRALERAWDVHKGHLAMIGCGGILDGGDILAKIMRGASAVQIYTALVYRGPWVVVNLLRELTEEMQVMGFKTLAEARGSHYLG